MTHAITIWSLKSDRNNSFDGTFLVPVSGTYVFTWAFMSDVNGIVSTQLMKNIDIFGTRYADSCNSTVWNFATGTAVVDVYRGDHIYVELRECIEHPQE
jgi:hypothetical protein